MYTHCSCCAIAFIHLAAADTKTSRLFTKYVELCGHLLGNPPPHFLYDDLRGEILVLYSSKYTTRFNADAHILFLYFTYFASFFPTCLSLSFRYVSVSVILTRPSVAMYPVM